jgi:hypothetical protein
VGINPSLSPDGSLKHTFNRKQNKPVPVACSIHPWMNGYVLPRDNPYVAVTAKNGSFTLEKLPAGDLEFQVWHEKAGGGGGPLQAKTEWSGGRFKLTIPADGVKDLGTIEIPASAFE